MCDPDDERRPRRMPQNYASRKTRISRSTFRVATPRLFCERIASHMGRYLGPKLKLSRRVGVPIADIPKHTAKELELPGMHGYRGRRNTEYGVRLIEKQKLRYHYGILEREFRRYLQMAKKSKGNT